MGKTNTTIEINGKRYDANTGELLFDDVKPVSKVKKQPVATAKATPIKPAHKAAIPPKEPKSPTMHDVVRRHPAKHAASHQPAPTKTLMRSAVKKPSATLKRQVKSQGSTDSVAVKPLAAVSTKPSISRVDTHRVKRAFNTPKSQLVNHFSQKQSSPVQSKIQMQPVVHSPAPLRQPSTARPHTTAPHKPKTTADMLERAIQTATSHEQPAHTPKKHRSKARRNIGVAAAATLSVAVIGFVVVQNVPSMVLHMASARAGFNAELPDYQPAGYSLGQLNYNEGQVASQFKSNSNDGNYTIVQKRSSWDSQALLASVVKPADPQYQTVQEGGRTIYIYGKQTATWVNGGIWYQIQSNGSLSDRQLVQIATSLN